MSKNGSPEQYNKSNLSPPQSSLKKQHSPLSVVPNQSPNVPKQILKRPNSVATLQLSSIISCLDTITAFEAAAHMAAKRQDAILVTNIQGHLIGILTDKDLAYKVISERKDPHSIQIHEIMTSNPITVTPWMSATDALNKMAAGGFRHLPVVADLSESNSLDAADGVMGVLEITKCLQDALVRLENAYSHSQKVSSALNNINATLIKSEPKYTTQLYEKLQCPDLSTVLAHPFDTTKLPAVSIRANVIDAVKKMKEFHETAVLVLDLEGRVAGIFTTKDVVLRVMAARLDPENTVIIRVMTPHPDLCHVNVSILDALHKMHLGRYLHLPVISNEGQIIGMVDILRLTFAILEQVGQVSDQEPLSFIGPWNHFWDVPNPASKDQTPLQTPILSKLAIHSSTINDSASETDLKLNISTASMQSKRIEPGKDMFSFKVTDIETGVVHRFTSSAVILSELVIILRSKIQSCNEMKSVSVSYIDEEGDFIRMTSDRDLEDGVLFAQANGWKILRISLDHQRVKYKKKKETSLNVLKSESELIEGLKVEENDFFLRTSTIAIICGIAIGAAFLTKRFFL